MTISLLAYPMHGQHKLSNEGYRTRDGHIIEWLGRMARQVGARVEVISRPEPLVLAHKRRVRGTVAEGTHSLETFTWRVPKLDPKHWWVRSTRAYPKIDIYDELPVLVWNPLVAVAPKSRNPFTGRRTIVLDLLDDWTIHHQFASINRYVSEAYRRALDSSEFIFANSEGTLELAHRFGRTDALLMPNGVDPDRFTTESRASGRITVGYVGKIGKRLDARLITDVCNAFPGVRFVFAGSFPDTNDTYKKLLQNLPNVELLGDVYYDDVPHLMSTFDIGWVPHAVGDGEVGGDAIKTYEYRATGLQVLTTPIIGASRLADGVHVVEAADQVAWLHEALKGQERIDRIPPNIPDELTWRHKARRMADALRISTGCL